MHTIICALNKKENVLGKQGHDDINVFDSTVPFPNSLMPMHIDFTFCTGAVHSHNLVLVISIKSCSLISNNILKDILVIA